MDAVALLLNAGDTVEAVHQAAWYVLLQESELLSDLGFPTAAKRQVHWEPDGGAFDLQVAGDFPSVWIELKVDSDLSEWQVAKQLPYTKKPGRVVYALLGSAAIRARPWTTKMIQDGGGHVLTNTQVCGVLDRIAANANVTPGIARLAGAYAEQLRALSARGSNLANANPWTSEHSLFLYDQLRDRCESMNGSVIAYVANPNGGFQACHWGWFEAVTGLRCYLQWEDQSPQTPKLCFKIEVTRSIDLEAARSAAVEFLKERTCASRTIRRPVRLGRGQTMTVGIVDDLPVRDEGGWSTLVEAMVEATHITQALAEHLRERDTP
jgi:hypothetical protein